MLEPMSLKEFIDYYREKGYIPLKTTISRSSSKKPLNDKQLKTEYKTYLKRVESKNNKDNKVSYHDEWVECREKVYARDNNKCLLWKIISKGERYEAIQNGYYGKFKEITPAHFIPRSRDSKLLCEVDNVFTISLVFHSRLDNYEDPLTGKYIGKDNVLKWWKRILEENGHIEFYNEYKDKF